MSLSPSRVTWLIPVRDGRRWLRRAAASALAQCGAGDEVVVVDDGSAEDPGALLPADPRVRLLRQPPRGIAAALERGRAACRGELIARLDADDVALPGRLEAQREALAADPRLAAVGGRATVTREGAAPGDRGAVPAGMRAYVDWVNGLRDPHPQLLVESPLFHPAVTLRAAAVAAVGGYRDGDFPEDYDLWLRLAGAGWRLANLDRPVVALTDRPDRLTRTDPRYRRAAFRQLKMRWLAAHRLEPGAPIAIWGAGRTGRPWIRWLLERGHPVTVLDITGGPGRSRQGLPVLPPEAIAELEVELLLVAVGVRGARALIRSRLAALRPRWREGRDWLAVA